MTLDDARSRLLGAEPLLLIDAPAGHGKTFEACSAAGELAEALPGGCRVLLLSHTNAARHALQAAMGKRSLKVVHQTLDSLAHSLAESYGHHLGVPVPLYPEHEGHPRFTEVREKAVSLLKRAPEIARAIALRNPVMIVDEHQDSTPIQHELVTTIASAVPTRLRIFGDDLQAIFDFAETIDWRVLLQRQPHVSLDHGYRWNHDPEFRDWLHDARAALLRKQPIELRQLPTSVRLWRWQGRAPGPGQTGHAPECFRVLWRFNRLPQIAVLVFNNDHALGIRTRIRFLALHEGADPREPHALLAEARKASGDAAALCRLAGKTMNACGSGVDKDRIRQLEEVCTSEGLRLGRKRNIRPLVEVLAPLYEEPNMRTWTACLQNAWARADELEWTPHRRDTLALLCAVRGSSDEEAEGVLHQAARARKETMRLPARMVTTIHKAKGLEFDEVVLPYVSESSFPATDEGRRRLYVALTRASQRLYLMVPSENPSPLVRL